MNNRLTLSKDDVEKLTGISIADCAPQSYGYANDVYKIMRDEKCFCFRIRRGDMPFDISAFNIEISNSKEAYTRNLAPRIYDTSVRSGWLLMDWIDSGEFIISPSSIGKYLSSLHSSNTQKNNFCFFSLFEEYRKYNTIGHAFPVSRNILVNTHDALTKSLNVLVPSHNDLFPKNIISDRLGKTIAIDWEHSGNNIPSWDIATFILESGYGHEYTSIALESHQPIVELHQLRLSMLLVDALWLSFAISKISTANNSGKLIIAADLRTDRILKYAGSNTYEHDISKCNA